MTCFALNTAWLTEVQNTLINELTCGTGCATSVCPNVFVVRCYGRDDCDTIEGINGVCGDILTALTVGEARLCACGTTISAFCTSVIILLFVVIWIAILDTFIIL